MTRKVLTEADLPGGLSFLGCNAPRDFVHWLPLSALAGPISDVLAALPKEMGVEYVELPVSGVGMWSETYHKLWRHQQCYRAERKLPGLVVSVLDSEV